MVLVVDASVGLEWVPEAPASSDQADSRNLTGASGRTDVKILEVHSNVYRRSRERAERQMPEPRAGEAYMIDPPQRFFRQCRFRQSPAARSSPGHEIAGVIDAFRETLRRA